jgi:glutamyl-tRNA synthetase
LVEFLFTAEFEIEDSSFEKAIAKDPQAASILNEARRRLVDCDFDAESLRAQITELGESLERKLGKVQAPIRVAVLGRSVGLPLFESLEVLGRERTLERIDSALVRLAHSSS